MTRLLAAQRGQALRVQVFLRSCLVLFATGVLIWVPPAQDRLVCWLVVLAYAAASIVFAGRVGIRLVPAGHRAGVRFAPLLDVAVLVALAFLADQSATTTWTADLVERGFFLIPVLAATLLEPRVVAATTAATVAVYLATSLITGADDVEPLASVLLRTAALAGLGAGAVLLSAVERARVRTITDLADDRRALLAELMDLEVRERRNLAEALHDGALQYVLAARQDLESARDDGDEVSFDRVGEALNQSVRLLRGTLARLHPAAVEAAGLVPAIRDLVDHAAKRAGLGTRIDTTRWGGEASASTEDLLVMTARELLANVIKHAAATSVAVTLSSDGATARLQVADDGGGMDGVDLNSRLVAGHLGLASRRVRIAAAGGRLDVRDGRPRGTVVDVELPLR